MFIFGDTDNSSNSKYREMLAYELLSPEKKEELRKLEESSNSLFDWLWLIGIIAFIIFFIWAMCI
jgi:flagellar biogenesis protein FliO